MAGSMMDCEYALRDENENGRVVTKCDCPGGCPYKKWTTKTARGIVGECTKINPYTGEGKKYKQEFF